MSKFKPSPFLQELLTEVTALLNDARTTEIAGHANDNQRIEDNA